MKKIKTSKKVKGMTLIEVIISMLVFGVTGVIMVGVCTVATTMMKETNHLNNKTDAEAPVAAVRDVDALRKNDGSGDFEDAVDNDGNAIVVEEPVVVIVGHANAAGTGMASTYDTYDFNKYSTASVGAAAVNANTNMNADLEFYVQVP